MSLLPYEDGAENGDKGHNSWKDKSYSITPGPIKDRTSHIGPEAAPQMVDSGNKTWNKAQMRKSVKSSNQDGWERGRDQKGKAEKQGKDVERDQSLIFQDQEEQQQPHNKC